MPAPYREARIRHPLSTMNMFPEDSTRWVVAITGAGSGVADPRLLEVTQHASVRMFLAQTMPLQGRMDVLVNTTG